MRMRKEAKKCIMQILVKYTKNLTSFRGLRRFCMHFCYGSLQRHLVVNFQKFGSQFIILVFEIVSSTVG